MALCCWCWWPSRPSSGCALRSPDRCSLVLGGSPSGAFSRGHWWPLGKAPNVDDCGHGHLALDRHSGGGMAHLHRLILWAFMAWASLGAPGLAVAVTPLGDKEYRCGSVPSGEWRSSYGEACNDYKGYIEGAQPAYDFRWSAGYPTASRCQLDKRAKTSTGSWSLNNAVCSLGTRAAVICPGNASPNESGGCSCNEGYSENSSGDSCLPIPPPSCPPETTRINGICVPDKECPPGYIRINGVCKKPPKCPAPGTSAGGFDSSSGANQITCYVGCTVSSEFNIATMTPAGKVYHGEGTYTGAECSGTGTGGSGDGSGSGSGGDGTGSGSGGDGTGSGGDGSGNTGGGGTGNTGGGSGTPSPTPTPPGSAPPPPQPQPPNEDGSCPAGTFKSGSSCIKSPEPPNSDGKCPAGASKVNGQCVFSEPVTGGGGGSSTGGGGGGTTGGGSGSGNGEGSAFAGNCGAGFACTGGDAIQCAIAKEQYVRNCKLFDDKSSPEAQRYLAAVTAAPSNATDGLPGNETVNLGPSRFDTTDALGAGGSGMTDLTVTVMGSAVSLPFSRINPYLAMFGNVLVAVSLILAARIVARG